MRPGNGGIPFENIVIIGAGQAGSQAAEIAGRISLLGDEPGGPSFVLRKPLREKLFGGLRPVGENAHLCNQGRNVPGGARSAE
jgi:hypothetical protein